MQYVTPMILLLFLSLMYKTMGGGSWDGLWSSEAVASDECPLDGCPGQSEAENSMDRAAEAVGENFSLAWQSLKQV